MESTQPWPNQKQDSHNSVALPNKQQAEITKKNQFNSFTAHQVGTSMTLVFQAILDKIVSLIWVSSHSLLPCMENVHTTSYIHLTKGSSDIQKYWLLNRYMLIYSKTSIFRNNSGITWDNWCSCCFTCCHRCGLGNHHSPWAVARFILSLNCWLFCWFWLKSQIHRIHRIFWVEGVFCESFCDTTAAHFCVRPPVPSL